MSGMLDVCPTVHPVHLSVHALTNSVHIFLDTLRRLIQMGEIGHKVPVIDNLKSAITKILVLNFKTKAYIFGNSMS